MSFPTGPGWLNPKIIWEIAKNTETVAKILIFQK